MKSRLIEVGGLEVRSQWLEVRSQRLEVRSERLETRGLEARGLEAGESGLVVSKGSGQKSYLTSIFYILTSGIYLLTSIFYLLASSVQAQTLDDYLITAAENNPGLKAKYAEFEAALQRVTQVNSLPDPTLSFGYFISPVETRVGPQRAKFSLSQMFPWFGTLATKGEMSSLMAEAKYQEFLNAKNELFYQVKAAWYPLYEVNRLIILQKENREILSTYKQLATSSFKNGKGNMVDAIRVDIMIDNTETEIRLLEDKRKPLLTRFNSLLNRADTLSVTIPDTLPLFEVAEFYRKDSLLMANPMLAAFDLKMKSAQVQEELARKEGLPKFGVGLDYIIVGEGPMTVTDNGKDVIMPMVSLSLPVFRGKYKAAVKEAQFTQLVVTSYKDEFKNNLLSSYEMAWYELVRARQLIDLYHAQVTKTEQVITLLLSAYSNSGKEFEEVLRMQQELLKYQMAESTALKEFYTALAKLDFITSK